MYRAVDIAWRMLQIASEKGTQLSNLQLQKLVYIAHGYMLAWKDRPLVIEPIEAWRYGPVISSIYHLFKDFGYTKIPTDNLDKINAALLDPDSETCISNIVEMYGKDAPESLIAATHQPDTPWYYTWEFMGGKNRLFAEMDNEIIKNHYKKLIVSPAAVAGL